jgi:hypothetical protein
MLHGRWGCYAPEKAKLQIPPCSPNLILAKLEIIGLLLLLSHAARSMGLRCALKGQATDRCRAHLILFSQSLI